MEPIIDCPKFTSDASVAEAPSSGDATSKVGGSDATEIMASNAHFRSLTPVERSQLIGESSEEAYEADRVIMHQGEQANSVYIVLSGRVRVVRISDDTAGETFLAELGPGEIFGELGVLRNKPRSATVLATERTRCQKMSTSDFLRFAASSTKISLALLRIVADRSIPTRSKPNSEFVG